LAYADNVNIVGENIDTIQRNTKALLDASKEVGLEVNPEKNKYMLVSRCQKAGQRQSIKIGNRSFESVAKIKYLGTMFRVVFWYILPCKMIVDRRFRGAYCLHQQGFYTAVYPRRQL
jgi:hypothetical protein